MIKNSSIQKIKFGLLTEQFYIPNNWNNKELKISQRYDEAINSASYLPDFYERALNTLWSIPHTWPLKLNFEEINMLIFTQSIASGILSNIEM